MLAFIVTMSMAWTERVNEQSENKVVDDIYSYMEGTADSDCTGAEDGYVMPYCDSPFDEYKVGETVYMYKTSCICEIERDFQDTMAKCREVTPETIGKEKLSLKIAGVLAKSMAPLL